jgi:hypothetical protein
MSPRRRAFCRTEGGRTRRNGALRRPPGLQRQLSGPAGVGRARSASPAPPRSSSARTRGSLQPAARQGRRVPHGHLGEPERARSNPNRARPARANDSLRTPPQALVGPGPARRTGRRDRRADARTHGLDSRGHGTPPRSRPITAPASSPRRGQPMSRVRDRPTVFEIPAAALPATFHRGPGKRAATEDTP